MPSEVARLVLGYLKSTGCHSAWETFLRESPDLKEYAEYVRRGREYPTNIAGKNLIQLLDTGFQVTQTQGPSNSSGDTVPNLQQISAQLTTLLAQLQSACDGNNGGNHNRQPSPLPQGATPSSGAIGGRSNSPSTLPQQRFGADPESHQPARLPTTTPSNFAQTPRASHSQANGSTLSYHVHTPLPPYPLLPPSIASMLKHKPLSKPNSVARFEPPEKDVGAFGPRPLDPKATASVCDYSGPPHLANPHLASYSDCYLAYINSLPRPMYARNPFMGDEEPVRDSGIDLRKRPAEKDDGPRSAAQASPVRPDNACQGTWGQEDDPCLDVPPAGNERSNAGSDQHNSVPTHDAVLGTVEPSSEGFEVSEAVAETRTEVSEEIDVDGSSRGPSPAGEEHGATVLPCQHPAMVVRSVAPSPVTSVPATSAASSPMLTTVSVMEQTPDHAGSQSPVVMETPENVGSPPPLPRRFPEPDSPRAILSQERSLQPSLLTPVKEIRFDINRFYSPRRKSLIPRRRLLSGPSPSSKQAASSGEASSFPEEPKEVLVMLDELLQNHPFVEKLVENINQAVVGPEGGEASVSARLEPIPEEATISTRDMLTSQDGSVSDTLIKDILSRTESDPVFEEVLAQLCEKLDTTSEVHGVLVTPKSKSCSKSRHQGGGGNVSPRTPRQSYQPVSLPTTPQLINLLGTPPTPSCAAAAPPRRSPRLNTPQWSSPSPPKTSSPSKSREKTTQRRASPVKRGGKSAENAATSQPAGAVPPGEPPAEPPSRPPSAPRQASPFKTPTSRSSFSVPVGVPLKSLLKTPSRAPGPTPLPTRPAVHVVSKAMEDGQTVTCISIPDLPQSEGGSPARCTTLADVINSILTPEHRMALCQTDSVATLAVSQPLGPQVPQVVLCTPGSSTDLRIPSQASALLTTATTSAGSSLVYPSVVLSSPFKIVVASPAVANSQPQPVAGSSTAQAQNGKPIAKKRLPLLQPKSPLPTEPSPPAAFKRLEKPRFSSVMGTRLKNKKLAKDLMREINSSPGSSKEGSSRSEAAATGQPPVVVLQSSSSSSSTSSPSSGAQQVATSGPATPTCALHGDAATSASPGSNHEHSPQLRSLVSRASKCVASRRHVRVLDFGGCLGETGAQGSSRQNTPTATGSGDQVAIIESIRTSLAGAMNRAIRNVTPGASTGQDSAKRKRKSGASNAAKAKKARSEDYLKSMDVNKFLDKVHQT